MTVELGDGLEELCICLRDDLALDSRSLDRLSPPRRQLERVLGTRRGKRGTERGEVQERAVTIQMHFMEDLLADIFPQPLCDTRADTNI